MKLPEVFLQSLEGVTGFDREAFVAVHEKVEGVTSVRFNPAKSTLVDDQWVMGRPGVKELDSTRIARHTPVPWTKFGVYLDQRPSFTFDPFFHAGCYYVQEASSMFLEQALVQLADLTQPLKVLDLCGAPGGKSTHIQSLIHPESLLVCNEVIKPRSLVLTDNIIKWGCTNVVVTNNDPRAFQRLPGFFDVMVVDAPCSGSGLFRKDRDAISEWSPGNVALCSQRQQRILADALPALKEDGLLIYSTCSYSVEEDEAIMDWLVEELGMENLPIQVSNEWQVVESVSAKTAASGYRFYPDKVKGEGFFLACFKKNSGTSTYKAKTAKPEVISAKEKKAVEGWVKSDDLEFLRIRDRLTALPKVLLPDFAALQNVMNIHYAGVEIGQIMKDKLVPAHALAQSILLSSEVPLIELSYDDAIRYLQRRDLSFQPERVGWQVACYTKKPLGWVNALKNRVNNYYPKEIRILKQNNFPFEK